MKFQKENFYDPFLKILSVKNNYLSFFMSVTFDQVITDVDQHLWIDSLELNEQNLSTNSSSNWEIKKSTLQGGLQQGVDLIEVNNGVFSYAVVPTRGMGIWRGSYSGKTLGWDSPVKDLVHPTFIELNDRGGLGWLKGFNEWIVRCGLSSNGAPGNDVIIDNNGNKAEVFLPLHGKIANIPARFVEVQVEVGTSTILRIRGIVEETMLFGPALRLTTEISTELGSNKLTIVDEVTNLNSTPEEIEMLYHCNYGPPFLEEGSKLVAPVKRASPRDRRARENVTTMSEFCGPTNGYVEQVYFYELLGDSTGESKVMLRNKAGNLGTSMIFSLEQMPCFSLWKNTASLKNGYVTGLEPGSNFPNPKRFERENGRVVLLEPLQSRKYKLSLEVQVGSDAVREVEREINQLQGSTSPEILEFAPEHLSAAT